MSPQMIQKLPAITLLEGMFPELSTTQLKVCVFYAMGVPYDAIAQNCRLSVRTYLKRSLKNLNLEGYDALRSAVLMRTFVFMINNTAKENEKM
ncbi:TPA: helix-turn-helix transcriptional regulator [Escherichia coli]